MEKDLHLGVARRTITPPLGSGLYSYRPGVFASSVHDDLTVTAFAFSCGDERLLLISATVGGISTALADELRTEAAERTAFPAERVAIFATHTHSGPLLNDFPAGWGEIDREYVDGIFRPMLLAAAEEAASVRVPVKVAVARGNSEVGVNRRRDGEGEVFLVQNPDGCFDPAMTILSFAHGDKTIANMIVYGCHGTCAGINHEITRDWSGGATDALERATGGITAYFNSTEGDVGPRLGNGLTTGDITYTEELAGVAARDTLRIFAGHGEFGPADIDAGEFEVELPLKPRIPEAAARKRKEELSSEVQNLGRAMLEHFSTVVESYENGYRDRKTLKYRTYLFRIGNIVFAAFPSEMFTGIGLALADAFPGYRVLTLSLTNGQLGYFPTREEIPRGGYEVAMFRVVFGPQELADDASDYLIAGTKENIRKFLGKDRA